MRLIALTGVAAATGYLLLRLAKRDEPGLGDAASAVERQLRVGLDRLLAEARKRGDAHLDVNAGALHRQVGGYPGPQHHMPLCCRIMREALGPDDFVVREPRSGTGPSLTLRYHLSETAPSTV